jgi:hypothetical protein
LSDTVLVALIVAVGSLLVAITQIVGVRINTRQHGKAIDALSELDHKIDDIQVDLREVKADMRDVKATSRRRHEENIKRFEQLETDLGGST